MRGNVAGRSQANILPSVQCELLNVADGGANLLLTLETGTNSVFINAFWISPAILRTISQSALHLHPWATVST